MRNNSSESRIDKIQEVGKDLLECGFLKDEITGEITSVLTRRDQLHHQVNLFRLLKTNMHHVLPDGAKELPTSYFLHVYVKNFPGKLFTFS